MAMFEAKDVKITDRTTCFESKIFSVTRERIFLPDRGEFERDIVRHFGAAVMLPLLKDQTVLLTRQYRHPLESFVLELPAGTIEDKETALDCAKREIVEEVGYRAEQWTDLGRMCSTPGFCNEILYCYLAEDLSEDFSEQDDDEAIEVVQMSLAEMEQAILDGTIYDAKTIVTFTKAKLAGII